MTKNRVMADDAQTQQYIDIVERMKTQHRLKNGDVAVRSGCTRNCLSRRLNRKVPVTLEAYYAILFLFGEVVGVQG